MSQHLITNKKNKHLSIFIFIFLSFLTKLLCIYLLFYTPTPQMNNFHIFHSYECVKDKNQSNFECYEKRYNWKIFQIQGNKRNEHILKNLAMMIHQRKRKWQIKSNLWFNWFRILWKKPNFIISKFTLFWNFRNRQAFHE